MKREISNVCAARRFWQLPHEPVMYSDDNLADGHLIPVYPEATSSGLAFKVCKHCGCVYVETIEEG